MAIIDLSNSATDTISEIIDHIKLNAVFDEDSSSIPSGNVLHHVDIIAPESVIDLLTGAGHLNIDSFQGTTRLFEWLLANHPNRRIDTDGIAAYKLSA